MFPHFIDDVPPFTKKDNNSEVQFIKQPYSPTSDISGTVATKGPFGNLGALSLMSCTLIMNSDFGSRASSVLRSNACACRT